MSFLNPNGALPDARGPRDRWGVVIFATRDADKLLAGLDAAIKVMACDVSRVLV